jgi:hypothetical protein
MIAEEINRYLLDGARYVFDYDGNLWKYRQLDTTNMGWAKFHGTLSKEPYTGIWVRERSEEPDGKEIDEHRAVLHCRRIELEKYRGNYALSRTFGLRKSPGAF